MNITQTYWSKTLLSFKFIMILSIVNFIIHSFTYKTYVIRFKMFNVKNRNQQISLRSPVIFGEQYRLYAGCLPTTACKIFVYVYKKLGWDCLQPVKRCHFDSSLLNKNTILIYRKSVKCIYYSSVFVAICQFPQTALGWNVCTSSSTQLEAFSFCDNAWNCCHNSIIRYVEKRL